MRKMDFIVQFFSIFIIITISSHSIFSKEIKLRCQIERVHNLLAYNCADMKLNEIPKYLKTSTEVIDASENRIRRLTSESFSNYRGLKYIYLFNNMIIRIDPGTFEDLELLEVLDLSINSLRKVPAELTELPNLRRLYLADNDLRNEGFEPMEKQIRSPLQILNIAFNDIDYIPSFGMMPLLETLNVTGNPLEKISPEQFAPFCVLKKVDALETKFGSCTCHNINFFVEDEMHLSPILECKGNFKNCKVDRNTTRLNKNYITCTNEIKQELLESVKPRVLFDLPKVTWPISAFVAVIVFLFLSMLFAHCMQKPRQRQTSHHTNGAAINQQPVHVHQNQVYEMEPPFRVNPGSRSTLIW